MLVIDSEAKTEIIHVHHSSSIGIDSELLSIYMLAMCIRERVKKKKRKRRKKRTDHHIIRATTTPPPLGEIIVRFGAHRPLHDDGFFFLALLESCIEQLI